MFKHYKLTEQDFKIDVKNNPFYANNIFFHINFHISEEKIGNTPINITHEIVYNTTILDETMRKFPDELSKKYRNIKL